MRPARFPVVLLALAASACSGDIGPDTPVFRSVSAGDGFSCALASDGSAWCWGNGTFGQLGTGTTGVSVTPSRVAGSQRFVQITSGNSHACALDESGLAWCWGLNDFRELGTRTANCNNNLQFLSCSHRPVPVDGSRRFTKIAAAGYYTCGLDPDGAAWCWGWSNYGQVGSGAGGEVFVAPTRVLGGHSFVALALDAFHACGLTGAGSLYCWGSNRAGELGAATGDSCTPTAGATAPCSPAPVAAARGLAGVEASLGASHTCLLTAEGAAWCWGSNAFGALGSPGSSGGFEPVPVAGGRLYRSISAGRDHNCAIASDYGLYCWGSNAYGESGPAATATCQGREGPVLCEPVPVRLHGAPRFVELSAGASHSCGRTAEGEIFCWGRGTEGQLGNGSQTSTSTPSRVHF